MKNKRTLPKITIFLEKDGKKTSLRPSIRKMQFFLKNKAESYFKNDYLMTIRVSYGKGMNVFGQRVLFHNSGTYENLEDLRWAFEVFVKDYLK